jgi:hypothetical protein
MSNDADDAESDTPQVGEDLPEGDDPGHAVAEGDLQYPTLDFADGEIADDGGFDLSQSMGREEMSEWLTGLDGALASHDLGVESPDGFVTFGVGPQAVDVSFEPDDAHRGTLEVTFRMTAKAMFVGDEDDEKAGSRAGKGFVPLSMVTEDRDVFRCYSWIDDPENPE